MRALLQWFIGSSLALFVVVGLFLLVVMRAKAGNLSRLAQVRCSFWESIAARLAFVGIVLVVVEMFLGGIGRAAIVTYYADWFLIGLSGVGFVLVILMYFSIVMVGISKKL